MRGVRRGLYVPCWLGPPCKVKSDRFAVSRGYEGLDLFVPRRNVLEILVIHDGTISNNYCNAPT